MLTYIHRSSESALPVAVVPPPDVLPLVLAAFNFIIRPPDISPLVVGSHCNEGSIFLKLNPLVKLKDNNSALLTAAPVFSLSFCADVTNRL